MIAMIMQINAIYSKKESYRPEIRKRWLSILVWLQFTATMHKFGPFCMTITLLVPNNITMLPHGIFLKHNYICYNIFCNHFCFYFIIDDRKFDYPESGFQMISRMSLRVILMSVTGSNMSNMSPNSRKIPPIYFTPFI